MEGYPFHGLQENAFSGSGPHLPEAASKLDTSTWSRKCSEYFNTTKEGHGNLTVVSSDAPTCTAFQLPPARHVTLFLSAAVGQVYCRNEVGY